MPSRRVLLVEDEPGLVMTLTDRLVAEGYEVESEGDAVNGLARATAGSFDAILLDVMLPGGNGFDVCRTLRQRGIHTPILMLTARGQVVDKVVGLKLGADDYLVKPFELRELLARMRAIIRRAGGHAQSTIGTLQTQLDLATRQLVHEGATIDLSAREFHLMHALLERPGAIVSRTQLEERIYGWGEEVSSNAVEVLIHGVRRKAGADVIRNVRGLGWRVAGGKS
jgi:DNA-binding response OmpR family regulator